MISNLSSASTEVANVGSAMATSPILFDLQIIYFKSNILKFSTKLIKSSENIYIFSLQSYTWEFSQQNLKEN